MHHICMKRVLVLPVLFLSVLLNGSRPRTGGFVILLSVVLAGILVGYRSRGETIRETAGNTEAVGWVLYTKYLVPFEVVSVVLLVAMIGAIVFGRRDAELASTGKGAES